MSEASATGAVLADLSEWIDEPNHARGASPEAVTWGRLAKVSEECGEVIAAYIGATGQNPRKGVTHSMEDVRKELLDVALTALCAVEHLDGAVGASMLALEDHVEFVARRAGLIEEAAA